MHRWKNHFIRWKNHFIVCECFHDNHTVRLSYFPETDRGPRELSIHYQLIQHQGFFRRVWTALRYIFKRTEPYGHWDCTLIGEEEAKRLLDFLSRRY